MLERELEARRAEALRQLQQEDKKRDTKAVELEQEQAGLDAARAAALRQMLRAQEPLPVGGVCPTCWIWDGKPVPLKAINSRTDNVDLFRCTRCGEEFEVKVPG